MEATIQLEHVRVENLFGRLTYEVDFKTGSNVSIVLAPNGCGKTSLFKLISFIFNPDFDGFNFARKIPFSRCVCSLANGCFVELVREERACVDEGSTVGPRVNLELRIHGNKKRMRKYEYLKADQRRFMHYYDRRVIWRHDVVCDQEDFFDNPRFREEALHRFTFISEEVVKILSDNGCGLSVNFICADRLHSSSGSMHSARRREDGDDKGQDPLAKIQNEVRQLYGQIVEKYNMLQQQMKDALPKMYLKQSAAKEMGYEAFKERWVTYVEKIEKFCSIGLLSSNKTILAMNELEAAYKKKATFLEVYLEAFERTLAPLEDHYGRLKLFCDIINRRNHVTNKQLRYGDRGLVMTMGKEPLSLEWLSSGEKNDLVMFYNLIFRTSEKGLVLIDEPEISLHVEWKIEYLENLLRICELNKLQAIVATHSPSIVNGRFELYANMEKNDAK